MSQIQVEIVDVKPLAHNDKTFLSRVLIEHNKRLAAGWEMQECRVLEVEEDDQREGKYKRFIGWQIVYSRIKPETPVSWDR